MSGVKKQLNLDGGLTTDDKRRIHLTEEEILRDQLKNMEEELKIYHQFFKDLDFDKLVNGNFLEEKFKEKFAERFFLQGNKIIFVDDSDGLVMKHKINVFPNLIEELTKIYNWLDNKSCFLKLLGEDGKEYTIHMEEMAKGIDFLSKLEKITSKEFTKFYNWFDDKSTVLRFVGTDEKEYIIHKKDIKEVIDLLVKLKKAKKD